MDATRRIILHNERGVAMVYLALTLVVLMGIATLAVDAGYLYVAKSQLQNAADAAALAGAAKLNGDTGVTGVFGNYSARTYAQKFALKNSSAGEAVKLALNDSANSADGDIFLCRWTGSDCVDPGGQEPNAVKVVARKTNETTSNSMANNSKVSLFFAKVLNSNWASMGVTATAIAAKAAAGVAPIAVNEYWLAALAADQPSQTPYGNKQVYPNSFVRKTNVNGSNNTGVNGMYGKTFALFGTDADNNRVSSSACNNATNNRKTGGVNQNVNGYVNLSYRSDSYRDGNWYQANNTSTCPSCSYLSVSPTDTSVNNEKFDSIHLQYLFHGLPADYLPPIPVTENYNPNYLTSCDPVAPTPPGSPCPYSTVAYFSSGGAGIPASGSDPLAQAKDGKTFIEQFPPGTQVITLVYDGIPTVKDTVNPQPPNSVTVVGYSLIEIDGYSGNHPKFLTSGNGKKDFFSDTVNVVKTMYGHAVSDILTGGNCAEFSAKLNRLRYQAGTVKLVK